MSYLWNKLDIEIKAAIIGAVGAIIAAITQGIFTLVKKDSRKSDRNPGVVEIPKPKATVEKQQYNAEEYAHNSFIPSLSDLEKEDSDDAFAEGLGTFLAIDRKDEDISITKKGE